MNKYFALTAILVIGCSMTLSSCKEKGDTPIPDPVSKPKTSVVWKKSLKKTSLTSTMFWYQGSILFAHPDSTKNVLAVYRLEPETGESIWTTRIETSVEFLPADIEQSFLVDDKLILNEGSRLYALDAQTGNVLWRNEVLKQLRGIITVIDGYVYASMVDYQRNIWSSLYRFDLETGQHEQLFELRESELTSYYSPDIMMPVLWNHPNGDEILVMQNRGFGWHINTKPKMDIFAYNLTADSIFWYREWLDGFSSVSTPAISGDNVYFFGDHHAYCINPIDGTTKWKFFIGDGPEDDFNTANVLIVGNKLIVKPDNSEMHAVDKETGQHLWTNKNTQAMPGLLTAHKDTIWFASAGIIAVDANTGEKFFDWDNDHRGSWIFPILHHPTNGKIYTSDASYFYCLDPTNF